MIIYFLTYACTNDAAEMRALLGNFQEDLLKFFNVFIEKFSNTYHFKPLYTSPVTMNTFI